MIYDVIIIGGGVSALTAGIYTARKKLKTLIVAKEIGGQTAKAPLVENYPGYENILGIELVLKIKNQLTKLNVKINDFENVLKISKTKNIFSIKTNKSLYKSKTIIIASGKQPRKLNIPGEKEFVGRGVAYCATCDAPLFKNKIVTVIGSGNSGLSSAIELGKYAKKVYILESSNKSIADSVLKERIKKDRKFKLIFNAKISEISGEKFVKAIKYIDQKQNEKILNTDGVFIEIGWIVDAPFISNNLKINKLGEIIINQKTCETNIKGLFASGDITDNKYKQIVIAAGSGAVAGLSVNEYLNK